MALPPWNGQRTDRGLGHYTYKNYTSDKKDLPLKFFEVTLFAHHEKVHFCSICSHGPFKQMYKVSLEWGKTRSIEDVNKICRTCLEKLNSNVVEKKLDLRRC